MRIATVFESLNLPPWAAALLALVAGALLAVLARMALVGLARRLTRRTATRSDDILVEATRRPITTLLFLLGVRVALEVADLPARWVTLPTRAVLVLTILVAAYGIGAALLALLREYAPGSEKLAPISGFLSGVVRALVLFLAILISLDSLGISITPLLASLGIGSVAVALALQDTLGNFFAGIALLTDRPFRVGEMVRIEPDIEGKVVELGWRTTVILDAANSFVVIPNATLAKANIRNFDRPDPSEHVSLRLVVSGGAPAEKALKAVRDAIAPLGGTALLMNLDEKGLEIGASLPAPNRAARGEVRSKALAAVSSALRAAGIEAARADRA